MTQLVSVGVDVGATKIELSAAALDSGRLVRTRARGWHWRTQNVTVLMDRVRGLCDEAMAQFRASRPVTVGAGVAGLDWEDQADYYRSVIATATRVDNVAVANDSLLPLFAEGNSGYGIALVAGSGCNCRGRLEDGRTGRVVGTGEWNGEYGSAGCLVRDATRRAVYSWVGRGPSTTFAETLCRSAGASDLTAVVRALSSGDFSPDPSLAITVFDLAEAGDGECTKTLTWAGEELSELVRCVANQMDCRDQVVDVALGGSLLTRPSALQSALLARIRSFLPFAVVGVVTSPLSDAALRFGLSDSPYEMPHRLKEWL